MTRSLIASVVAGLCLAGFAHAGFTQRQEFGSGFTLSVAWGDYENDGDLDLAVANHGGNELYTNNGDGTFTGEAEFDTASTFAIVWGDADNDGDLDAGVGNGNSEQNWLFVGDGAGGFTRNDRFGRRRTNALAWADYDRDGDLDMAVANGLLGAAEQNRLFVNNGDGTFIGQDQFGLGQSASAVWGDCDGDGDADLAVGNGGFGFDGQNFLYVNNGDGTFTERAEFGGGDTAGLAWGDTDNDGDLDMAVGNWRNQQNLLFVNDGAGNFTQEAQFGLRDTNTLSWGDADDDGDLDVAVGNGDFTSADTNFIYLNNGDGTFTSAPQFGLGSTDALAWGDFDGDLDLDVAVGNEHSPQDNYLYVNEENDGAALVLHLVGHGYDLGSGYSNRDGIGAKVDVYEAGLIGDPAHRLGFREVEAHGGFSPQGQIDPHFGLPGRATVDVRIVWPGSGSSRIVQFLPAVAVGQRLVVHEQGSATAVGSVGPKLAPEAWGALEVVPNPMRFRSRVTAVTPAGREPTVEILDVSGRLVRRLGLAPVGTGAVGRAEWDGRDAAGRLVASGVYFFRAAGAPRVSPKRVVVLR